MVAAKSVSPADVHFLPCRFVARGEAQHEAGREPERHGGSGIGGGRGHLAAFEHRQRKAGGKELEARGLAGVALCNSVARPRRPAQQMVDGAAAAGIEDRRESGFGLG